MDIKTLITNALEYHDKNNDIYKNVLKKVQYKQIISDDKDDGAHNIIVFYDSDKKELFRSRYEIIGIYQKSSKIWIWAWAMPLIYKKSTNLIRRIWNYGATLGINDTYLKTELVTSRFRVIDPIQIEIHISIAMYLSKVKTIYENKIGKNQLDHNSEINTMKNNDEDLIQYLFLLDSDNIKL
jgi:hypothetical protein